MDGLTQLEKWLISVLDLSCFYTIISLDGTLAALLLAVPWGALGDKGWWMQRVWLGEERVIPQRTAVPLQPGSAQSFKEEVGFIVW